MILDKASLIELRTDFPISSCFPESGTINLEIQSINDPPIVSALAVETTTTGTADYTPIANLVSVGNQTRGKTGAPLVSTGTTKPSILSTTGGATREYSEDAVFELLQRITQ